ncbi:MAG TPA: 3-ketoacyl-ACP reductase [Pirellulales bacterium]|jgi:NAD(P)-dependent dehydrogenase (short-subunit alcohol dehydrogenase family)|nr:3-ketoacyl-ACP reductase [Pirellulales bacterium]
MIEIPVALVTGGSRGIGRAIALELSRSGHAVAVNYAHRAEAAEQVVAEIRSAGGDALAVRADVAAATDREAMVAKIVDRFGRIDVLVNNAGITSRGRRDLLEATEESWDQVFATNLKGPFFLAQRVARVMIDQVQQQQLAAGTIVNVSSISAYAVSTDRADYCLTKAATGMMTWLFADRLAEFGIHVFEVCPGVIATDMTGPVKAKYDRLISEGFAPIRRWGQPEDVAKAVAALVRGELPFSTGQRIDIDGGFHIRRL